MSATEQSPDARCAATTGADTEPKRATFGDKLKARTAAAAARRRAERDAALAARRTEQSRCVAWLLEQIDTHAYSIEDVLLRTADTKEVRGCDVLEVRQRWDTTDANVVIIGDKNIDVPSEYTALWRLVACDATARGAVREKIAQLFDGLYLCDVETKFFYTVRATW